MENMLNVENVKLPKLNKIHNEGQTALSIDEELTPLFNKKILILYETLNQSNFNLTKKAEYLDIDYNPKLLKGEKAKEMKKMILNNFNNVERVIKNYISNTDTSTKKTNYYYGKDNIYGLGRIYANGNTSQNLNANIRGYLYNDNNGTETKKYLDVDLSKSFYTILIWLCKGYNINTDLLQKFINEYENYEIEYIENYLSCYNNKKLTNAEINKHKQTAKNKLKKIRNRFIMDFKKDSEDLTKLNYNLQQIRNEIIKITDFFYNHNDFSFIKNEEIDNEENNKGSFMSYLLTTYENIIIMELVNFCKSIEIKINVVIHDGIILLCEKNEDELKLCNKITNHINNKFIGLNSDWKIKKFKTNIKIDLNNEEYRIYEDVVNYWTNEKDLCKINGANLWIYKQILNRDYFGKKYKTTEAIIHKPQTLRCDLGNEKYDFFLEGNEKVAGCWKTGNEGGLFIPRYMTDINLKNKNEMVSIPNYEINEDNEEYNIWSKYPVEEVILQYNIPLELNYFNKETIDKKDKLINHILEIANHELDSFNYIQLWISHLLKYPEHKKTTALFFYSNENGSGKDSLIDFITNLIGNEKVAEISDIKTELFGDFNGHLQNKILCKCSEVNRLSFNYVYDKYKNFITNPNIMINQKNIPQFNINSQHRIIGTCNNDDPIKLPKTDRRTLIFKSSETLTKLKDNDPTAYHDYFNYYHNEIITNADVLLCCYVYFMSLEPPKNMSNPTLTEPAKSKYQKALVSKNKDILEEFLFNFCIDNIGQYTKETEPNNTFRLITESDLYKQLQLFIKNQNSKYEITKKDFKHKLNNSLPNRLQKHIERKIKHNQQYSKIEIYDLFNELNDMYGDYDNENIENDDDDDIFNECNIIIEPSNNNC